MPDNTPQSLRPSSPAFPFGNSIDGVFGLKSRRDSIKTAIQLILLTPKGSLPYDPEFGSQVPSLLFDPITDSTIGLIYYYVQRDLEEQELRIVINSINIDIIVPRKLQIRIGYSDINDVRNQQEQAPVTLSFKETP